MDNLIIDRVRDLHLNIKKNMAIKSDKPRVLKNLSQVQIMFYLHNHQNDIVYQKDLCEALKLKKSSITEHLDYLEEVGEIIRVQDENDRRKNSIKLSEKALEKKAEIDQMLLKINEKVIKDISKEDLEKFEEVLKKMEDNLKK